MSCLPYELIALDLDYTLLNDQHTISPRNLAAVHRCRDLGVKVIITSGRMYYTTLPYLFAMGLDTPVVAYNGAFIKQECSGEILLHAHLDVTIAQQLVEFCACEGLHLNYYLDDVLYTAKSTAWSDLYSSRTGAVINPVDDLRIFADRAPTKVLIVDEPAHIQELYSRFAPRYQGQAYVTISNVEYLEFMPAGVDKGTAMAVMAEHYGISQVRCMAFGDAGNDSPAIAWAGLGVAMENATPEAKAVANRLAPPYDEDGVAIVLEEIFGFAPSRVTSNQ